MSAQPATLKLSIVEKAQPVTDEVIVGKDVLELLAGAMYADPLTIYREYIQNAADSIDIAREAGVDAPEGFGVQITFDIPARSVTIRDNGASIPDREFVKRLTTIGASSKRGKNLRGFRGVGRLSGLGYCQEIVFRGRAEREPRVTELRWDGRKLRELLRDATYEGDLRSLVRSVVEVRRIPGDDFPPRFFEVELRKVSRLRGDFLLNDQVVRTYLSQVAPVPFHPDFTLGPRITDFLESRGVRKPIHIYIAGTDQPIYHRTRDTVAYSEKLSDSIQSVEFLEFRGQDADVEAFGWILDHAYLGAVPKRLGVGGIRLRAGDIQVGDDAALASLFTEPRFAPWAIGDIHVASPRILPNARRDDFEASIHYAHLQDEMSLLAKRITQTIRDRSLSRNRVRAAQSYVTIANQWISQAAGDVLPPAMIDRVCAIVDANIVSAQKELARLPSDRTESDQLKRQLKETILARDTSLKERPTDRSIRRSQKEKALDLALGVILEHAATPHAGLVLSRRIINAFEA